MAIQVGHLSGSTDGKAILVATTSSTGTTIHTAVAATDQIDRIWLYCNNTGTDELKLTIEWGEAGTANKVIENSIPPEGGAFLVVEGFPLQNSLVVTAYAATANFLDIHGYVLRSTAAEAFN